MRLAAHLRQLDDLLWAFHDLWHPQPFCQSRPNWCQSWPVLADELLKLDDADVIHLNIDGMAALALLARHIPAVAEIAALAELPRRPVSALIEQCSSWAWEIPGRKKQQIEAFASVSQCTAHSVIDWCGGKGHLGRLLALQWRLPVHTLEIDPILCADGAVLASRQGLNHEFLNIDALTAADWPKPRQHAVALHACGDLHRRLIEHGASVGVARFDIAPCCYHRGIETAYQPLSGKLRTALTRADVRLAVTETVTASARLTMQRDKEMAWKLGFDNYRRAVSVDDYQSFKPVPAAWFRGGFGEFLSLMAERQGLPPPGSAISGEFEAAGWRRQHEVMRLSIVRHAFRRALEIWLALDLAVYLENRGYSVEVGRFCERQLTPRNLLISAQLG
ncbi:MAG: methyltransferase [Betaproteobacteria bacterium HGW-Betaproteobacteria-10]|nr:MAG: methyltransferase [Betaproteobacteria bacterium HGW-Betaproteobacteria-10]